MLIVDSPFGGGPLVDLSLGSSENVFICSTLYSPSRMKRSSVLLSDGGNCLVGVMHRWWLRDPYVGEGNIFFPSLH